MLCAAAIDGLITARAGDKAQSRERRMRRLIAQAAGRMIDERIRDTDGNELQRLVKAAASGEIGVAEAAQRALQIVR